MTLDQATKGGRTEVSVTKELRIGISGHSQRTKDGPQNNRGLDLHYDLGNNGALVVRHARSRGHRFAFNTALIGGLDIAVNSATQNSTAAATRARITLDLAGFGVRKSRGVDLPYTKTGARSAAPTQKFDTSQTTTELNLEIEISNSHSLGATYETLEKTGCVNRTS
ncbi:MAG: hypothetical protein HOH32_10590 [Rhodobacteraceae bacterium]|nr:hypothetical protein [Paracoccaceae bacterium]